MSHDASAWAWFKVFEACFIRLLIQKACRKSEMGEVNGKVLAFALLVESNPMVITKSCNSDLYISLVNVSNSSIFISKL